MRHHKLLLRLYPWEFRSMPEYSASLPTGQTFGKVWRHADQSVGMYIPHGDPGLVGIVWFSVELRHGPRPPGYHPPDWHNTKHFNARGPYAQQLRETSRAPQPC